MAEMDEVIWTNPLVTNVRNGLYRVVGQTDGGRYLTAFVGPMLGGQYYVISARDAEPRERRAYRRR